MEQLAGRPLPRFYGWFLTRMGRSMGPLAYPQLDFSVTTVLSRYDAGEVDPMDRFLMIGCDSDALMPLHVFYDLEHPARDDCRVVRLGLDGGLIHVTFATFREMIASGAFINARVNRQPQRCQGSFRGPGYAGDVLARLDPVMARLGFTKPVPTGDCCALYDRPDAAMAVRATPADPPSTLQFFKLGGADEGALRRILGAIATESSIEIAELESWTPPLP